MHLGTTRQTSATPILTATSQHYIATPAVVVFSVNHQGRVLAAACGNGVLAVACGNGVLAAGCGNAGASVLSKVVKPVKVVKVVEVAKVSPRSK